MYHIRSGLLRSETRYKQCVAAFQLAQLTVLLLLLDVFYMQLPVMEVLQPFCHHLVQFCGSFQQLGNIIAVRNSHYLSFYQQRSLAQVTEGMNHNVLGEKKAHHATDKHHLTH